MKQERTENQKQKRYPVNPQARPDYRDDDEYLPGQRQRPVEAQEDPEADAQISNPAEDSGNRADPRDNRVNQSRHGQQPGQKANSESGQDAQTREDIQRAEQEGMVKNKKGNRPESSGKKPAQRQQGASSRKN